MNRKLISRIVNVISLALLIIIVAILIFSGSNTSSYELLYVFTPLLVLMIIFSIVSRILSHNNYFEKEHDFDEEYAEETIFSKKHSQSKKKDSFNKSKEKSSKVVITKEDLLESKSSIYKTMIDSELDAFIDSVNNRDYKPGDLEYTHHCSKCNALINVNDIKCPECGEFQKRVIECNYCGHKNKNGAVICEKCGNILY